MNVTTPYLKDFSLPKIQEQPKELALTEWEEDADRSIGLDDQEGRSLSILYYDAWPSEAQWKIKRGAEKRWTLVRISKAGAEPNSEIIEPIGYEFQGLFEPDVLRAWFRTHLGLDTDEAKTDEK